MSAAENYEEKLYEDTKKLLAKTPDPRDWIGPKSNMWLSVSKVELELTSKPRFNLPRGRTSVPGTEMLNWRYKDWKKNVKCSTVDGPAAIDRIILDFATRCKPFHIEPDAMVDLRNTGAIDPSDLGEPNITVEKISTCEIGVGSGTTPVREPGTTLQNSTLDFPSKTDSMLQLSKPIGQSCTSPPTAAEPVVGEFFGCRAGIDQISQQGGQGFAQSGTFPPTPTSTRAGGIARGEPIIGFQATPQQQMRVLNRNETLVAGQSRQTMTSSFAASLMNISDPIVQQNEFHTQCTGTPVVTSPLEGEIDTQQNKRQKLKDAADM